MSLCLRQLFEQHQLVSIPLLQRDYAQGRGPATEVRERFLRVLADTLALPPDDPSLPLDLDFVYGSPTDDGAFSPLDGQQRLTTLFLLHWYLAHLDGRQDDFRTWGLKDGHSAFSYRVRASAQDFFDALVDAEVDPGTLPEGSRLSSFLRNQAWYFQSWELDPTIRSSLVVLDDLHQLFRQTQGLYARLVDTANPPITFQFLNLREFGLTDDLYIKMNARGKPLTRFETFKANLERQVKVLLPGETRPLQDSPVELSTYIAQRFDTDWCDLFWHHRSADHSHDDLAMNAIRAIALTSLFRAPGKLGADSTRTTFLDTVKDLRLGAVQSFYGYDRRRCVDAEFITDLTAMLDRWSEGEAGLKRFLEDTRWYNEVAAFKTVLTMGTGVRASLSYEEWLQFATWCDYLLCGLPTEGLGAWMRLVVNLTANTIYNRREEFVAAALGLHDFLAQHGASAVDAFADGDDIPGFFAQQQVREERLKAQLMRRSTDWESLIVEAETHGYYKGQVEFLLDFSGVLSIWLDADRSCSWADDDDAELRVEFKRWLDKANAVFRSSPPGLADIPDYLWERALLCEGNYLLSKGSNVGFLDNAGRQLSWKRLLRSDLRDEVAQEKRAIVYRVLKDVDPDDVVGSLRARVAQGVTAEEGPYPGWRRRLVERPTLFEYCGKRQMRIAPNEAIYLLMSQRRSGWHKELFTAHLEDVLRPLLEAGELAPFTEMTYEEVRTDSELPSLDLERSTGSWWLCITYYRGRFYFEHVPKKYWPEARKDKKYWKVEPENVVRELRDLVTRLNAR